MALTTTSEPSAVDRHAVVDGFVLSVADTITSKGAPEDDRSRLQSPKASRTTMLAASVHFFARSIKPTSSPNRARQLVQQQGPAHVGVSLFSGEREIKPGCIPAMIMSIASR
jgi:hypothetical protein